MVFIDVTVASKDAGVEPPWMGLRRVAAINTTTCLSLRVKVSDALVSRLLAINRLS